MGIAGKASGLLRWLPRGPLAILTLAMCPEEFKQDPDVILQVQETLQVHFKACLRAVVHLS